MNAKHYIVETFFGEESMEEEKKKEQPKNYWPSAFATLVSAGICGLLLYWTHGEHGIGWFIVSLLFIW